MSDENPGRLGWRLGLGLALLGATALAIGLGGYAPAEALALGKRVWPVLLFAAAMTVVAEFASSLGIFAVGARGVRSLGRGHPVGSWLLLIGLTLACTVLFSLDTTAVLITPLAIALARSVRASVALFALTVVWLANTGSLLLPISNLTNLLALDRLDGLSPLGFSGRTWGMAAVGVVVPIIWLGVLWALRGRRAGREGGAPEVDLEPTGSVLCRRLGGGVLIALLVALLTGLPAWLPACAAAVLLGGVVALDARAARGRAARRQIVRERLPGLGLALVPWRTLVLTLGLFGATGAISALGLHELAAQVLPAETASPQGRLAIAAVGGVAANLLNNLPAYLVLEPSAHGEGGLFALLLGVNAGPLITPWGSLATLLWHERVAATGERVSWGRFALLGAPVAIVAIVLGALLGTPPEILP